MNWTAQIDGFTVADWNKDGFNDLLICSEHAVPFQENSSCFTLVFCFCFSLVTVLVYSIIFNGTLSS